MRCTSCNYQNVEGNKFCESCGKPLVTQKYIAQSTTTTLKKVNSGSFSWFTTGIAIVIVGGLGHLVGTAFEDILGVETFLGLIELDDMGFVIGLTIQTVGAAMMLPWLYAGFMGGIEFSLKKIKGTYWWIWIFLFGLIPVFLWLIFLFFMILLGEKSKAIAENAVPTKKQCQECRGWNDYAAIRCKHCGQSINS